MNILIILCYITIITAKEAPVFWKRRESGIIIPAALHEKIVRSCTRIVEDRCEVSEVRVRKGLQETCLTKNRGEAASFRFVSGS